MLPEKKATIVRDSLIVLLATMISLAAATGYSWGSEIRHTSTPSNRLCAFLGRMSASQKLLGNTGYSPYEAKEDFANLCQKKKYANSEKKKPTVNEEFIASTGTPSQISESHDQRRLFISRDSISTLGEFAWPQIPGEGIPIVSPLGATISGTADNIKRTQSFSAQGYVGYCLVCGTLVGSNAYVSVGPAALLTGSFSNPISAASPITASAARMGPDLAADVHDIMHIGSTYFSGYFDALPFYQTDFRGRASMEGIQLLAEPSSDALHLRTFPCPEPQPTRCAVGFIWRVIPEADIMNVSAPGETFYGKGGYAWIGTNTELILSLFPGETSEPLLPAPIFQLLSKLSASVVYKYLVDADDTAITLSNFLAEIDYKIASSPGSNGGASIALSYQSGPDELTLLKQNVYKVSLNYKY